MRNCALVALQRPTAGALATPAQAAQDAPHVSLVIAHTARRLDQVAYPACGPQPGVVAQSFGTALESLLNLLKLRRRKPGFAASPSSLLQTRQTRLRQLPRPANHRLPVHAQTPRYFALAYSLFEQLRRRHPAPLQTHKVPPHTRCITHAPKAIICIYIMQVSIVTPSSFVVHR